ncbi:LpqB family beta-propeller domain-containing protein [Nocardioides hwasunensis]|uniref:GerMN domain-containing protein n=1 Tax=Nocardioides hwasunensis TaxID=397258 RepID=A0ABR8MEB9_9ACTN|nr:LpqB family beta-propeller domain-containing protein [Nocardioides hwasunensis]MBD3914312.1 GerMN domain-containing protein [Nocardioides hwasunensis]
MNHPTTFFGSVLRVAVGVLACALLAGCVQMPTSGPVVEPPVSSGAGTPAPGIFFNPRPPQVGETPDEIVTGFLEAMKATPIRTTVARQFLTREAADGWAPEQQILTYAELGSAVGQMSVQVPLNDVNRYDSRGAWEGTEGRVELDLGLVQQDGEWRIDEVPDALIVPASWFDDWYQRVSLYYFDPTSEVLVPEPVHVPRGDQFASSLVRGLLAPVPTDDQDVVRTFFPPGTTQGLMPVQSGIAQVSLSGDPDAIDTEIGNRMLVQLAWTLRQDPDVKAVELTIGDRLISYQGGSTQVNLGVGADYDPNGVRSDTDLFALDDGRVVTGTLGALGPTVGPLGEDGYDVRSIGVSIDGSRVAAVTGDGTGAYVASTEAPDGEVLQPVVGAVDLAPPRWDYRGRVWLLDRGAGSARVILVEDDTARVVEVPGLSGRRVSRLLVSRDGTRMVAVVRGPRADRVVAGRIRHAVDGQVIGFTSFRRLPLAIEGTGRIRDIGWRSPTAVSVLRDISDGSSEVRTTSVDGAPGEIATAGATRIRGTSRALVASPVDSRVSDTYALTGREVTNLTRPERVVPDLPEGLTSLTYVG